MDVITPFPKKILIDFVTMSLRQRKMIILHLKKVSLNSIFLENLEIPIYFFFFFFQIFSAMERAITFLETKELPPHWDKEILNIGYGDQESTNNSTTASSESEDLDDEDEEEQSPEEKDHLVAELYKHMEDRGSPIDKTPCIGKLLKSRKKTQKSRTSLLYSFFLFLK